MSSQHVNNIFSEKAISNIANFLIHLNRVHIRLTKTNNINPPAENLDTLGNYPKTCYYPDKYETSNRPR